MDAKKKNVWLQRRKRIGRIIEVGSGGDLPSRLYDIFSTIVLLLNLTVTIMYTFDRMEIQYGRFLLVVEAITVAFFAIDYILRVWTARIIYPGIGEKRAIRKYVLSFTGLVDLLSFLPYYLPFFFPSGTVAFRMFRVVRVFRLFQINAYYDALNVIKEVIASKRQQLFSSIFVILVLMVASSLCMYSLEHDAQPDVFSNAFSGIWWSVSTLLTIGYGDIYPITTLGKVFSIFITFLGVGMVAIPTGIISAGFVEQYSRLKRISEYASESDVHFIKAELFKHDAWVGKAIRDLGLPHGVIVAMIRRGREHIIPRGDVVLKANDTIILGAEALRDDKRIELKELVLLKQHPWNGHAIRDLDISRRTFIVMVRRNHTMLIPKGSLVLLEGDQVILYSQEGIPESETLSI